jgi:transglutaminase-like putative cysteine protease
VRYYTLLTLMTDLSMLVGTAAVATSEESPVYLIMVAVGLLLAWRTDRLGEATPVPVRVLVLGSIFGYTLVDQLLLGTNLILTLGHLVAFAMLVKATAVKGPRDYFQIYLLSLCQVIVGGYFASQVVFAAVLVLYLATTGWAMMVLVMTSQTGAWVKSRATDYAERTLDRQRLAPLDQAIGVSRRRFLLRTAGYVPALLVPAVLLFVLMPRGSGRPLTMPLGAGGEQSITGFSERMQLGDMANILQNFATVMQVRLVDPLSRRSLEEPRVPLLWRGLALDTYSRLSHWTWRKTFSETETYRQGSWLAEYLPERTIQQEVLLQPIDSPCLFSLSPILRLESANIPQVNRFKDDGSMRAKDPPPTAREYTVISAREPFPSTEVPDPRYLQVPDEIRDSLRQLARSIAPDVENPTPLSKAQAIVRYFRSGRYGYSLSYRGRAGAEPVTEFLFETRRGHCELYASAMALLLRTLGNEWDDGLKVYKDAIPTRVVNGFRGGEWNPVGRFIEVRQADAHSWVEAFVPGQGWRAFDPTPGAAAIGPGRERTFATYLTEFYEFLKWSWVQHVIQYDTTQQSDLGRSAADVLHVGRTAVAWNTIALDQAWRSWQRTLRRAGRRVGLSGRTLDSLITVATVALFAGAATVVALLARLVTWRRRDRSLAAPVEFYQALLRILARLGFRRRPAQTPMEFAHQVQAVAPEALDPVPWITEAYYRTRFGRHEPDADLQVRIREALVRLAALRDIPGRPE